MLYKETYILKDMIRGITKTTTLCTDNLSILTEQIEDILKPYHGREKIYYNPKPHVMAVEIY